MDENSTARKHLSPILSMTCKLCKMGILICNPRLVVGKGKAFIFRIFIGGEALCKSEKNAGFCCPFSPTSMGRLGGRSPGTRARGRGSDLLWSCSRLEPGVSPPTPVCPEKVQRSWWHFFLFTTETPPCRMMPHVWHNTWQSYRLNEWWVALTESNLIHEFCLWARSWKPKELSHVNTLYIYILQHTEDHWDGKYYFRWWMLLVEWVEANLFTRLSVF